ncbi:MAG: hypothetical protein AVDCRST_MAG56-6796 [uncultured Cytophagales bacterium]|uniref:Tryptophan-rich sensory protein n=1 Tax=uncultured Cytophagales bacterium TaxID=158755 RepID=A0A6J4KYP6_9SPHI|nr:MAG: hypothetical protein AVDCRST_MAG56-6796 [uncultured Cytophagales bacterium]
MEPNRQNLHPWRLVASAAVVLSIAFSYVSNGRIINGQNNADVSAKYPTLFTPAGYAFSIWGLIYLSLVAYAVYQLRPARRDKRIHDRLAVPLTATTLLSMVWLVLFNAEWLLLSVVVILGMLGTALVLLVRSREWVLSRRGAGWLSVPFSLYAGWLTVATIANASVYLSSTGWRGYPLNPTLWALVLLTVAVAVAVGVSWRLRDAVFPGVVAWASLAIWVARRPENEIVALAALAAALVLAAWTVFCALRLSRRDAYQTTAG